MERRCVALLVATDRYQDTGLSRLAAPASDMRQLATVLRDTRIAGFEVKRLYNRPHHVVGKAIGDFYRNRRRDDLTLLYFTGHGVKDEDGHLYLAMADTDRENLQFTGVQANQVRAAMEGCRSRQKVLVLDCCYAGAFPAGRGIKGDTAVHAVEQLGGRGCVVLTSSDAMQFSFEGNEVTETGPASLRSGPSSLFTRFLIEGLRTGRADLDGDGDITLDELYNYVHDRVTEEQPLQRPQRKDDVEGRIYFAQNIRWTLPSHISDAISSPYPAAKLSALDELRSLHNRSNAMVRQRVLEAVHVFTEDDSRKVSDAANQFLSELIRHEKQPQAEEKGGANEQKLAAALAGRVDANQFLSESIRHEKQPQAEEKGGANEQKLAAALAGRAARRDFVDSLAKSWDQLVESWASLIDCAVNLAVAAASTHPRDLPQADVFTDLARFLTAGADWRERASSVAALLGESANSVHVLRRRVHRKTVNIGVIGLTGAGKSTLLRKLSGLDEGPIPSNPFISATATPSLIFHEQGSGSGRARLMLHTWESFRAEVLAPLHVQANIPGPPPASLEEFQHFPYRNNAGEVPAEQAGVERYRRRLRQAQNSLPSYQALLRGGTEEITLDQLRPFVAYPADDDSRTRPYHAVRSVDIFCEFPEVEAAQLGLIDLPGTGEAGLDVHRRFLTDLRNNADLLFIVKRPVKTPVTDADWDVLQLADDAAAGVRRSDFVHYVINRDAGVPDEYFDIALVRAKSDGTNLGIDVRECDIKSSTPAQVAQVILSPVLSMLAERLTYMDRDATEAVLSGLAEIAAQVHSLAAELMGWIERRQADLPDEETRLRSRARELKNEVSLELQRLVDEYDSLYTSGAPIAELHEGIEKAGREMRKWLADGLGAGSAQAWLHKFRRAESAGDMGRELDHRYNSARKQVVAVFGGIDSYLDRSVDRLWGQVADALRLRLTEAIVPTGLENRDILAAFAATARQDGASTLGQATDKLLNLPTDYGSIFLRVGLPVVRRVKWDLRESGPLLGTTIAGGTMGGVKRGSGTTEANPAPGAVAGEHAGPAAPDQNAAGDATADSVATSGPRADRMPTAAGESAEASKWLARLSNTIEQVTSELEREFRAEAQRTLRVLAAAVDLFKDTAITTPDGENEFEKLCRPVQREIWSADFGGPSAEVAADLATLRQRAAEADAAAGHVASLTANARRL